MRIVYILRYSRKGAYRVLRRGTAIGIRRNQAICRIRQVAKRSCSYILRFTGCMIGAENSRRNPMSETLTERRAEFVYNAARLAAEAANAPIIPVIWNEREEPFKEQFLKVIVRQCGEQRSGSPEELHGSWMQAYFEMGWVYGAKHNADKKTHPDLVPYADLGQLERDKDAVFVALCEIARQWIY